MPDNHTSATRCCCHEPQKTFLNQTRSAGYRRLPYQPDSDAATSETAGTPPATAACLQIVAESLSKHSILAVTTVVANHCGGGAQNMHVPGTDLVANILQSMT